MLRDYSFDGAAFEGLEGLGGHSSSPSLFTVAGDWLMQTPFRRMGTSLPLFEHIFKMGQQVAVRQKRRFSLDVLRQVLTLAFVEKHIAIRDLPGIILVIGDGFGALSSLLLSLYPNRTIMVVNLVPVLLADIIFIRKAFPDLSIAYVDNEVQLENALMDRKDSVIAVRADLQDLIRLAPIDIAFNIVSMQEMMPAVISQYFLNLRKVRSSPLFFYCCNRLRKTLPDGTVTEFMRYPWRDDDRCFVDELCPWCQKYYKLIPPRYIDYDGPIQHRLVQLSQA